VRRSVLLIEDCPETQQSICEALQQAGYRVAMLSDPEHALATVEQWAEQFDLVIIEEIIRGRKGLELLRQLHGRHQNLPILVLSREGDWNGYALALSEGARDYLPCPVEQRTLLHAIEQALTPPT
jgi:DNA-binding response OmpR family regulator